MADLEDDRRPDGGRNEEQTTRGKSQQRSQQESEAMREESDWWWERKREWSHAHVSNIPSHLQTRRLPLQQKPTQEARADDDSCDKGNVVGCICEAGQVCLVLEDVCRDGTGDKLLILGRDVLLEDGERLVVIAELARAACDVAARTRAETWNGTERRRRESMSITVRVFFRLPNHARYLL